MMLNPIFESSARRRMRTIKTPIILTLYWVSMLIFSLSMLTDFMGQGLQVYMFRRSTEWIIWATALQFFLIVLVAPALSACSIAGERERQTFDLLLITGIGVPRIILGKLMEHFAFLLLLIVGSFPIMMLANVTGGMPVSDILMIMLFLAIIAFAALSVGIVVSTLFKRSLSAIVVTYLAVFAIGISTWIMANCEILAADSYEMLCELETASPATVLASIPKTIFLNPAVMLVMLLAGETGILHRTMEDTMRLMDIYTMSSYVGFSPVAKVGILSIFAASVFLIVLAIVLLYVQTNGRKRH